MTYRILDTFCKAGGAGMGYYQAGFEVVGVDIEPQKNYPFPFILGDAIDILRRMLDGEKFLASDGIWYGIDDFDAIHASPPCQAYSLAGQQWRASGKEYPDLLDPTRKLLIVSEKPYVIENVPGAPLINPTILNGAFFGMNLRRTRLFETSFDIPFFLLPKEGPSRFRMGRKPRKSDPVVPVGHFSGIDRARKVMGIDWMTGAELTQAIPPAYTKFIGEHLIRYLEQQ